MLEGIRIRSLGVIDSASLELGPGLTAITGETGAGKTMVVTALGLLLGQRGEAAAVRAGARRARVEGEVLAGSATSVADRVEALGGEVEDGRLLIAREVGSEGRSRAFVGGAAVPIGALADLAEGLVAVHGQSDQHRLLRPAAQREALDRFGGTSLEPLRTAYAALHTELTTVVRELDDLERSARERAREADLLGFGLREVAEVAPEAGEEQALATEEARLAHADALRTAAEEARQALSNESDGVDAVGALGLARRRLEAVREHDPAAGELADRLAEAGYVLADLATDVASYAAGVEIDPLRLAAVSERRAALRALTRRYGDTIEDVLAWAVGAADRLGGLHGAEGRIEELQARRTELRRALSDAASALSAERTVQAARLAEVVVRELAALAMPHARVVVAVRQRETSARDGLPVDGRTLGFGPTGVDEVELLLAPNPGAEPRSLSRGASGGELSRVMLAVEVALAGTSPTPTFVFDEVDAGVGGKAAVEVGRRLAMLARTSQVLVVTHLPQVAAYADRHVVVAKSDDGTVTAADLTVLDDAGRQRELSRMLAGLEDSETALAHARELLAAARASRA